MTRTWAVVLVAMALAAGCTNNAAPTRTPPNPPASATATPSPPTSPGGFEPWTFDLVAATGGADRTAPRGPTGDAHGYLEGMQLAVWEANARGGVAGRPSPAYTESRHGIVTGPFRSAALKSCRANVR